MQNIRFGVARGGRLGNQVANQLGAYRVGCQLVRMPPSVVTLPVLVLLGGPVAIGARACSHGTGNALIVP